MVGKLKIQGKFFIDELGRRIMLRGINLGGSSKVPVGGETHIPTDFSNHHDVNFIGRPFSLDDAAEHLARLRHWGFNTIRLLTTWEAIEHGGPKNYDTAYLNYLAKIVEIAGDYGMYVFIDPHQDVWSRMTGGDGAPGWVFEKVGLDFTKFDATDASIVMQYRFPHDYPPMRWAFNYWRFATSTMFTLFFGGRDFAPETMIDGLNVQDYLQQHFIESIKQVAFRVKDMEHVIGFEPINEPHPGYIGIQNLQKPDMKVPGPVFSPFDGMVAAAGFTRKVPVYRLVLALLPRTGSRVLNPDGISCWSGTDIWQQQGIWSVINHEVVLNKPAYFAKKPDGSAIDVFSDYFKPMYVAYAQGIRSVIPDMLIFVEDDPMGISPFSWQQQDPQGIVYAGHWYDDMTLFTKSFSSRFTVDIQTRKIAFGKQGVKKMFLAQLRHKQKLAGNRPMVLGEFGLPFDLNKKKAYQTGDFTTHETALSLYYQLLDELHLNSTQWNYTADNTNQWGDQWNMEDLSIYSNDQRDTDSIDSGGRAIKAFCRPYVVACPGELHNFRFDEPTRSITLEYTATSKTALQVFLPTIHFPNQPHVDASQPIDIEFADQIILLTNGSGKITVHIS